MANNRALAAALGTLLCFLPIFSQGRRIVKCKFIKWIKNFLSEDAQLELRSANLENVQLRKQIHEHHHHFVEKTRELEKELRSLEQLSGNHVPKAAQVRLISDISNYLNFIARNYLQIHCGINRCCKALPHPPSPLIQKPKKTDDIWHKTTCYQDF